MEGSVPEVDRTVKRLCGFRPGWEQRGCAAFWTSHKPSPAPSTLRSAPRDSVGATDRRYSQEPGNAESTTCWVGREVQQQSFVAAGK